MLTELEKSAKKKGEEIPVFYKKIRCPRCEYQRTFLIEKMADRVMLVERAPVREITDKECSKCNKGQLAVEIEVYNDENM